MSVFLRTFFKSQLSGTLSSAPNVFSNQRISAQMFLSQLRDDDRIRVADVSKLHGRARCNRLAVEQPCNSRPWITDQDTFQFHSSSYCSSYVLKGFYKRRRGRRRTGTSEATAGVTFEKFFLDKL